jgi:hypothetical protein
MALAIRNPKDFWSGVLFAVVGAAAVVLARDYPLGTTFKMGPGYFPTTLGALLTLVGLATALRGLWRPGTEIGRFALRELALVLVATILFGVLLRGAGLLAAVVILVLLSAYASERFRWGASVALAAGMAVFCLLVFVKALGLPIPILGPWLGQ